MTNIQPENLQNIQNINFWQKAVGVNGLICVRQKRTKAKIVSTTKKELASQLNQQIEKIHVPLTQGKTILKILVHY